MAKNYCGNYGCKNCEYFRHYPSYNYYEPDEYECAVPNLPYNEMKKLNDAISYTDEEIEERIDRAYGDGEEWDNSEEQICPYYKEIKYEDF